MEHNYEPRRINGIIVLVASVLFGAINDLRRAVGTRRKIYIYSNGNWRYIARVDKMYI